MARMHTIGSPRTHRRSRPNIRSAPHMCSMTCRQPVIRSRPTVQETIISRGLPGGTIVERGNGYSTTLMRPLRFPGLRFTGLTIQASDNVGFHSRGDCFIKTAIVGNPLKTPLLSEPRGIPGMRCLLRRSEQRPYGLLYNFAPMFPAGYWNGKFNNKNSRRGKKRFLNL